jgi:LuxR family maltose regulon positive regulatory protein
MAPETRAALVYRSTLVDRIEKGIAEGFILISAPPGYGKTTLLAEWAQQHQNPIAWLTLDADDNDLLNLNRYLRLFIEKNFPEILNSSETVFWEGNAEKNFHALIVALINGCMERETEFTLILDDYQVIQNQGIHDGFNFLLDHFPPNLRLIIASRVNPPFALMRLRANQRVLFMGADELKFSLAEADLFLNQILNLDIPDPDLAQIYNQTEGWAAGLQLAGLSQHRTGAVLLPKKNTCDHALLMQDYLIEEVFNHQPHQIQDFLIKTSILENLHGSLCDYVLNTGQTPGVSGALLHTLYRMNLFIVNLDGDDQWFRYHPLFAEALHRLLKEKNPEQISTLFNRASEWCDQNGYYDEALSYARSSRNDVLELTLLEKYSAHAVQSGRFLVIFTWIKRTDEKLLSQSPLLCLMCAWGLLMSFDLDLGEVWLNKARMMLNQSHSRFQIVSIEKELREALYITESLYAAINGENEKALDYSRKVISLLPEENGFVRGFGLLNQAITLAIMGESDQAVAILEETIQQSRSSGNWVILFIANCNLGELLINRAQYSRAMTLFQQILKFLSENRFALSGIRGVVLKQIGYIHLMRNDLEEASRLLNEGIELTKDWMPSLNELDNHLRLASLYHCLGDVKKSREEIDLAREFSVASQGKLDDVILDIQEARLNLLRGQTFQAHLWAQKNCLLDEKVDETLAEFPLPVGMSAKIMLARLYLVEGRQTGESNYLQKAVELLGTLLPQLTRYGMIETLIEANILMSLSWQELKDSEKMLEYVHSALKLAETEMVRQFFLDEGILMLRLLTACLAQLKQAGSKKGFPSRRFVSDLIFRMTEHPSEMARKEFDDQRELNEIPVVELLTIRELEILKRVAGGRTNGEIASDFHLSINTVKRHLSNIFQKLGVNTRTQAIAIARRQGWL